MDLGLPGIDGWEATRQLKADAATRHIPIIVLSAHAMINDREMALAAGGDDFDTKPVRFEQLLEQDRIAAGERGRVVSAGSLLVVDDNEPSRDALSRRLRQRGFDVAVAANGAEALALAATSVFDLVLLDVEMPG